MLLILRLSLTCWCSEEDLPSSPKERKVAICISESFGPHSKITDSYRNINVHIPSFVFVVLAHFSFPYFSLEASLGKVRKPLNLNQKEMNEILITALLFWSRLFQIRFWKTSNLQFFFKTYLCQKQSWFTFFDWLYDSRFEPFSSVASICGLFRSKLTFVELKFW